MTFQSETAYFAEKTVYHVRPCDAERVEEPWYTQVTPLDPPLTAAFVLRDLHDVTVDLGGAKLVFHGRVMPFKLVNCRNVTLKNFSIDYERPFFTQGSVVDSDRGSLTLEIPDGFGYRVEKGELIAVGENFEESLNHGAPLFQPYDTKTGRLSPKTPMMLAVIGDRVVPQENPPCPIYKLRAESLPGRRVRLAGVPDFFSPEKGETVAFTHENRHKTGFQMENCADIVLEDVRLLHIGALAVIANLCRDLTFRRFSCYLDGETGDRIVTVNADVLHGFHCAGKILAEDCRFENMLDDALNFHGNYSVTEEKLDAHTFFTVNRSASLHHMPMYLPGDVLHVYRGKTQELKAVYTVESAEYLPRDGFCQRIAVRESLRDFFRGDVVESQRMPELLIRNCESGHARGGWRISTGKKVLMENCRFENTPIMFTGDTNYWYENAPVRDVEIRNSVFTYFPLGKPLLASPEFDATEKAPFYHSGIRIHDNLFEDCPKGILGMRSVDGLYLENNRYGPDCSRETAIENCGTVRLGDGEEDKP